MFELTKELSFCLCPVQKRSVFWPKLRNAAGHAVSCMCLALVPPKSEWTSGINSLCASCINTGTLKPDFPLYKKFTESQLPQQQLHPQYDNSDLSGRCCQINKPVSKKVVDFTLVLIKSDHFVDSWINKA